MSAAISLEHVHRSLGGEVILGDVSLSIAHGQSAPSLARQALAKARCLT
ncbi:hypothetical protein [Pseudomonas shirazensis]